MFLSSMDSGCVFQLISVASVFPFAAPLVPTKAALGIEDPGYQDSFL